MPNKKTLVLGASTNPYRYSYLALNALQARGHDVTAIGKRSGKVGNVEIETKERDIAGLDTVTLYLNPLNQKQYYDYILIAASKTNYFQSGSRERRTFLFSQRKWNSSPGGMHVGFT